MLQSELHGHAGRVQGGRRDKRGGNAITIDMKRRVLPPEIQELADIDFARTEYEGKLQIIEGVVSLENQGSWPGQTSEYKVHSFSLIAWRKPGGPIVRDALTMLRPVAADADFSNDCPAYSLLRANVLLALDGGRAVVERRLPNESPDAELDAIASELQKPVTVVHPLFGVLTLDRRIGWFEGIADWNGKPVTLTFPADESGAIATGLATAEAVWADSATWKQRVEDYAVQELLPQKNESWLEEGEAELSAEQFLARITLARIAFAADGTFEFWHQDGDLFGGQMIEISGNLADGPTAADIAG